MEGIKVEQDDQKIYEPRPDYLIIKVGFNLHALSVATWPHDILSCFALAPLHVHSRDIRAPSHAA
jgi:hypothetical protein